MGGKNCFSIFLFTVKSVISELKVIYILLQLLCSITSHILRSFNPCFFNISFYYLVCLSFSRRRHYWLYNARKPNTFSSVIKFFKFVGIFVFCCFYSKEFALSLISSLFIVKFTAFADGTILKPCSSLTLIIPLF